jgi:nucleoside permease NupC
MPAQLFFYYACAVMVAVLMFLIGGVTDHFDAVESTLNDILNAIMFPLAFLVGLCVR